MKELRDIKLDLLMGNQNPIIDLFNQITKDIKIINTNVYNEEGLEFIYFVPTKSNKDYEWVFYQDAENDKFWCNFATYWSFFENKLGLEYLEIQSITKYLVEEVLKREVVTPIVVWREILVIQSLENLLKVHYLKREVATPLRKMKDSKLDILHVTSDVEDALKREISNPKPEIHKMDSICSKTRY